MAVPSKPDPDLDFQPFRFLDLPKEIRLCVYEKLPITIHHVPLPGDLFSCLVRTMPLVILSTCRIIHSEATWILKRQLDKLYDTVPQMIFHWQNGLGGDDWLNIGFLNGRDFINQLNKTLYTLPYSTDFGFPSEDSLGLEYPTSKREGVLLCKFYAHAVGRYSKLEKPTNRAHLSIAIDGLEIDDKGWGRTLHFVAGALQLLNSTVGWIPDGGIELLPVYDERNVTDEHRPWIPKELIQLAFLFVEVFDDSLRRFSIQPIMPEATWVDEWEEGVKESLIRR